MKYTVIEIINDFVVLENRLTLKTENIKKNKFNFVINEGDIIYFDGRKYIKLEEETKKKKEDLRSRLERLKGE